MATITSSDRTIVGLTAPDVGPIPGIARDDQIRDLTAQLAERERTWQLATSPLARRIDDLETEVNRLRTLHADSSDHAARLGHQLAAERAAHAATRESHLRVANQLLREVAAQLTWRRHLAPAGVGVAAVTVVLATLLAVLQ
jgi:hypothetical protein